MLKINNRKRMKKNKITFYNKLEYVNNKSYMDFAIYFLKVNIFSIFMEGLLTFYLLESLVLFTNHFMKEMANTVSIIFVIALPLMVLIVFGIPFCVILARIFINKMYRYSLAIEKKPESSISEAYQDLLQKYKKMVLIFHIAGSITYCGALLIICKILVTYDLFKDFCDNLHDPNKFVIVITLIGSVLGLMWNITGFFRNNRIDWHSIIKKFSSLEHKPVLKMSYRFFLLNSIFNILMIIIVVAMFGYVFCNLRPEIISNARSIITDYNFLIIFFATIFSVYCKKHFSYIYTEKGEREKVFPSIKEFKS